MLCDWFTELRRTRMLETTASSVAIRSIQKCHEVATEEEAFEAKANPAPLRIVIPMPGEFASNNVDSVGDASFHEAIDRHLSRAGHVSNAQ